jgi:4-alpha-glucanotransferase
MKFERASGILLHPTSLPGKYGIGDIGPQAHRWLDFLARSGCKLWQVLPLGPTGYGDSPYQCFSAFAGNPYLVSPEALLAEDLLHSDDLAELPDFPAERVDYGQLIPWKLGLLDRSYQRFESLASPALRQAFSNFEEQQASWLGDFALFMALKEAHAGQPWTTWEPPLRDRDEKALEEARRKFETAIRRQKYRQFLFFRQWDALHAQAGELSIRIIGDLPIFVAHDSVDVWAHPELFFLDAKGIPSMQAGVPPDYFSPTGQLWGNPLYRWQVQAKDGYAWWLDRIKAVLSTVDIIRIDHFRGFAGYWEVPQKAETAEAGRWVPGPGANFFQAVQNALGALPIIAEDLGVITPDVVALREQFDLPGMKILQFAFGGGPDDPYLPHNYPTQCVVYTGTHDNDTAHGWYERVSEREKDLYRRYFARDGRDVAWDLIRGAWSSVAVFALAPMQDFLSLGNEARMNQPGNPRGNWTWRMDPEALSEWLRTRIDEVNYLYSRKEIENAPENIASSQKAVDYFL